MLQWQPTAAHGLCARVAWPSKRRCGAHGSHPESGPAATVDWRVKSGTAKGGRCGRRDGRIAVRTVAMDAHRTTSGWST